MFNEDFLHYIWKFKRFNTLNLKTTCGKSIQIIKSGVHNKDSGPDFFNANVKIDQTIWVGNVEIHVNSSDWDKHKHSLDKAYQNVILHVVYNHDKDVKNLISKNIPTIELKPFVKLDLLTNYNNLVNSNQWVPCANQIKNIDKFILNNWLERLAIERLETKTEYISSLLKLYVNDWDKVFFHSLLKYFGSKINKEPFEVLAQNTPINIFNKHNSITEVEALLFGQSGMLNTNNNDEYFLELKKEYEFLKKKFNLQSINSVHWKFFRLRPNNFPTIRLAQLAQILHKNNRLFSKVLDCNSLNEIKKLFQAQPSLYWQHHHHFEKKFKTKQTNKIGDQFIEMLIINVIIPCLFAYSKYKGTVEHKATALNYLKELKKEKNSIIKKWESIGVVATNAKDTQALLTLKNDYCSQKKCLNCQIGNSILK